MTTKARTRKPGPAKPKPEFISREEGRPILEEQAQKNLGMSAAEFIRKWDAGEFENPDTPAIISVYMLLPLVR